MVNGQRIVYFNAANAAGQLQIGGAPPLPVLASPVPANHPAWLMLTIAVLLAAGGLFLTRRRNPGARGRT